MIDVNIPNLAEVKKSIERIEKKGFPKYTPECDILDYVNKITNIIRFEFGILFNAIQKYPCSDFKLNFFRARNISSISNINLIRDHSYPPIGTVGMGRCNFPGLPVFYCSSDPITALIEVWKKNEDPKYCISKWELIPSNEPLIFESFLQSEIPLVNPFSFINKMIVKRINEPFEKSFNEKLSTEQSEGLLEFFKYLHSSFITDNKYSLSATLAYNALFSDHNYRTDILMYPSVQSSSKSVNLALNPNFVENNLKLTRLYIIEPNIYDSKEDSVTFTMHKYATIEKNVVFWETINPENEKYKEMIKQDFGIPIYNKFEKIS